MGCEGSKARRAGSAGGESGAEAVAREAGGTRAARQAAGWARAARQAAGWARAARQGAGGSAGVAGWGCADLEVLAGGAVVTMCGVGNVISLAE